MEVARAGLREELGRPSQRRTDLPPGARCAPRHESAHYCRGHEVTGGVVKRLDWQGERSLARAAARRPESARLALICTRLSNPRRFRQGPLQP
jgi:hypothetical protein